MENTREVQISGWPVTITGPGIQYRGWMIYPVTRMLRSGKRIDSYMIEFGDGERRSLCDSVATAKRAINARICFSDAELEEIKMADREINRKEYQEHYKKEQARQKCQ